MQVDRSFFKVAVSQQHLDRAQIGTGFKQMRCEAMPQRMRMDVLVLQASTFCGPLTGRPEHLGGYRTTRCVPSVAGKKPVGRLAPEPSPVDT